MLRFAWLLLVTLIGLRGVSAKSDDVLSHFVERAGQVRTMSCNFRQVKKLSLLSRDLESTGRMFFDNGGKLCWEYLEPYEYRFVLNGDKVYVGNAKRNNVIDVANNKIFSTISRVMMNTVTGRLDLLEADFGMAVSGAAPARVVALTPKRREMKQLLKLVELTLDEKAGTVTSIRLCEKNGDVTDISLTDTKLNNAIDETHFIIP